MALLKEDPATIAALLEYAMQFPDFPKNFSIPSLADPNYEPPDRGPPIEKYAYAMMGLTTWTVIARLWIRKRVKGMVFGWDDWLIIPGQILALGMMAVMVLLIRVGGTGMHVYDLSFKRLQNTQKLEFVGVLLYLAAIFFIRVSITALLYRLMGHSSKTKRVLLHVTVIILVLEFIIQVFLSVFATNPISAGWDMRTRVFTGFKARFDLPREMFIMTIFCLAMDVWLLVLPIHTFWTLQLPLRTRISVTWVFIFGAVACVGATLKACYIYAVFNSYDPTWNGTGFVIGALTEVAFGVVSSSMPALNHILVTTLPRSLESMFGSKSIGGWFSSDSSKNKDSDRETSNPRRNYTKTTSNQDDCPFYDSKTPFYDGKEERARLGVIARTREITTEVSRPTGQTHVDDHNPRWLSAQFAKEEKDLEANNALDLTTTNSTETGTSESTTFSQTSNNDINQYSWLQIR